MQWRANNIKHCLLHALAMVQHACTRPSAVFKLQQWQPAAGCCMTEHMASLRQMCALHCNKFTLFDGTVTSGQRSNAEHGIITWGAVTTGLFVPGLAASINSSFVVLCLLNR
jgi:hypothetical protein